MSKLFGGLPLFVWNSNHISSPGEAATVILKLKLITVSCPEWPHKEVTFKFILSPSASICNKSYPYSFTLAPLYAFSENL